MTDLMLFKGSIICKTTTACTIIVVRVDDATVTLIGKKKPRGVLEYTSLNGVLLSLMYKTI